MPTATSKYLSYVKTDRKVIAVCRVWHHYSIIDNEVNDSSSRGEERIPVTLRISNVPRLPTADSASFSESIVLHYSLEDRDIKKALGITGAVEIDGDGTSYEVYRARNMRPLYRVEIVGWDEVGDND